jgi:hypothetical protein
MAGPGRSALSLLALISPAAAAEKLKQAAPPESEAPPAPGLGPPGRLLELIIEPAGGNPAAPGEAARELLIGAEARRQLVVTAVHESGQRRDATSRVRYESDPPGIVEVDGSGLVTPLAGGKTVVRARLAAEAETDGDTPAPAEVEIAVERFGNDLPINFPNQIVPIFTKHGCNGGGCHGKASGQNGFKLSLLGFHPEDDHEYLVHESRGRRLFPAAPEHSLLLLKATNSLPHGGGQRIEPDSHEYRLLRRWMLQGMPYGSSGDPHVTAIEVVPAARAMERKSRQQIRVFARYSDSSLEDVTRMAQYESNDTEIAEVTEAGVVKTLDLSGEVAVMVRYQAQVGVFRATVPLGVEVEELPPARSFIDELVFAKLQALGIPPSPLCDDATFVRRVTLDICGRLPAAEETRRFLADPDPDKRERLIDELLESTAYADFFANKWSAVLRNKSLNGNYTAGTYAFHDWIRDRLHRNQPYDRFVGDIVAASGEMSRSPPVVWYRSLKTSEQQVEDAAQLFLGLRIQCARCHHHPYEKWSQDDYYGFAAFFSRLGRKGGIDGRADEQRIFHQRGVAGARNPRTGETLKPTGLGGAPLALAADQDPRLVLADWMADQENPFFAPALVNRYWKHFFGRGIVEPEDDLRVTNPPSNPELLEALARRFVESGFDLKELVRAICRSAAYQLSSLPNDHNARDKQNFSRYYPRRLNAEVLYDAINQVTGTRAGFGGLPPDLRAVQLPDTGINNYFLTVFGKPMADSACECERTNEANLAQSLYLLNSNEVLGKLSAGGGRAAQLAADASRSDEEKVRELYEWVYSRPPLPDELTLAVEHLAKTPAKQQGYEDILWALLNTKEFLFNH